MQSKRPKDNLWVGLAAGFLVPLATYGVLMAIVAILHLTGLLDERAMAGDFPNRTLSLLAICGNLLPVRIFNRQYLYNRMRGVVFPTLLYVVLWVLHFYDVLFA